MEESLNMTSVFYENIFLKFESCFYI